MRVMCIVYYVITSDYLLTKSIFLQIDKIAVVKEKRLTKSDSMNGYNDGIACQLVECRARFSGIDRARLCNVKYFIANCRPFE